MVDIHLLCSKLNNTEAKLTAVPPHFFVIVIATAVCACFVIVLLHIYLSIFDVIHIVVMVVSYYLI